VCNIENEGPLKVIEARICEDTLYQLQCNDFKCNTACRKKYGKLASGMCNVVDDCTCHFPC